MCMVLPQKIQEVVDAAGSTLIPEDSVMRELKAIAAKNSLANEDLSIAMAIYMLGFPSYNGFAR